MFFNHYIVKEIFSICPEKKCNIEKKTIKTSFLSRILKSEMSFCNRGYLCDVTACMKEHVTLQRFFNNQNLIEIIPQIETGLK